MFPLLVYPYPLKHELDLTAQRMIEAMSGMRTGPEIIKLFFILNSAAHGLFSTYKYKNANYSN